MSSTDRVLPVLLVWTTEKASRIGAVLGNANDRAPWGRHDRRADATRLWFVLNRVSTWLYVMPDRRSAR